MRSTTAFSSPMGPGWATSAGPREVQGLDWIQARGAQGGIERAEQAARQAQGGGDQGPLPAEMHDQGREDPGQIPGQNQRESDADDDAGQTDQETLEDHELHHPRLAGPDSAQDP